MYGRLINDFVALSDCNWVIVYLIIMRYLLCFVVIVFTQPKCVRPPADNLLARLKRCLLYDRHTHCHRQSSFSQLCRLLCQSIIMLIGYELSAVQIIIVVVRWTYDHGLRKLLKLTVFRSLLSIIWISNTIRTTYKTAAQCLHSWFQFGYQCYTRQFQPMQRKCDPKEFTRCNVSVGKITIVRWKRFRYC